MLISVREALNKALEEQLKKNENVFLIGEEVAEYNGAYKISQGLLAKFGPKRIIDSPISEYGFAGLAVGAAFKGLKPIVEFMSFNFSMQAVDHIMNSAAKTSYMSGGRINPSIVFRGPNGFAKGVAAQHSQSFANWYSNCPNITVIAPYDALDAYGLLYNAVESNKVVVFLEQELLYNNKFEVEKLEPQEIGKAKIRKEGTDLTLISFSKGVEICEKVIKKLQDEGRNISIELIDLRTIKPLDIETILNSIKKTNKVICLEDGFPFCGICSEIITQINENVFDYLDHQPIRITSEDVPTPYAQNLELASIINEEKLYTTIVNNF